jgi:acyl-CoA dehydrogenase
MFSRPRSSTFIAVLKPWPGTPPMMFAAGTRTFSRITSQVIVPADTPGITLGKPDKKMGQRGTKTCDVILDNVRVPAANIIGGVAGQGFKTAMKVLDRGRLHISALACGMAHRLITDAVA